MPILKILDQEGNEVENAQVQDGAQINVIEKITINGGTTYITIDQDGEDKKVEIDTLKNLKASIADIKGVFSNA